MSIWNLFALLTKGFYFNCKMLPLGPNSKCELNYQYITIKTFDKI